MRATSLFIVFILVAVVATPLLSNEAQAAEGRSSTAMTLTYTGSATAVQLVGEWDWDTPLEMNFSNGVWTVDSMHLKVCTATSSSSMERTSSANKSGLRDDIENSLLRVDDHLHRSTVQTSSRTNFMSSTMRAHQVHPTTVRLPLFGCNGTEHVHLDPGFDQLRMENTACWLKKLRRSNRLRFTGAVLEGPQASCLGRRPDLHGHDRPFRERKHGNDGVATGGTGC